MLAIFLSALILFFILSPGILGKFPPKGNKFTVAIVHALVFSILFSLVFMVIKRSKLIEGIKIMKAIKTPAPTPAPCTDYFCTTSDGKNQVLNESYGGTPGHIKNVTISAPLTIPSGPPIVANLKTDPTGGKGYPYPIIICDGTIITIDADIMGGFAFIIKNGGKIIVNSSQITSVEAGPGGGTLQLNNPSAKIAYILNHYPDTITVVGSDGEALSSYVGGDSKPHHT
jgi:hypothetical protein